MVVWLASFSGNTVHWLDDRYLLKTKGRLVPLPKKGQHNTAGL
jgi:hypothetical protein